MKKIDAHNLICEALVQALNEDMEEGFTGANVQKPQSIEFRKGFQAGMKARVQGGNSILYPEQLKSMPPDFVKGYKKANGESWWNKFNDKLTQFAGALGYSRTRDL